ncbi:MAG: sulfurtransferase [Cyanobacteria bacterium REEB67]|nr:sulfurtransferase [Cyanobacteria bacterium REEB67]
MPIANIAAYKFVSIVEPGDWLSPLTERCNELELKGTIVLATEGINLFLAGTKAQIDDFLNYLANEPLFGGRFCELDVKYSWSENQPFKRMVVRVAREIITMRHPLIKPEGARAPVVDAPTLKTWLDRGHDDEGRPIVLMDTRNAFEVAMGTFAGAIDFDIERFSEFPDAVARACADQELNLKDKTIVSFCTGGIRCEKAALYLKEINVNNVYQLDGGILRYFEEAGGAHWGGECFVFDERVAVDPALQPTKKYYEGRTLGEKVAKLD